MWLVQVFVLASTVAFCALYIGTITFGMFEEHACH